MGIKDIFKKLWEHSDSKKRKKAIDNLDDQNILVDIAKNDKNESVRLKAVKK
ncbi:MAG: hypothetical protein LBU74_06770 [Methanobacteriaceae archaeon]|nr:hypothetical protein [Candidatus Methanorudis spinitermitis]